jgi:hypothetical protein
MQLHTRGGVLAATIAAIARATPALAAPAPATIALLPGDQAASPDRP